jgi:hypothetical protein
MGLLDMSVPLLLGLLFSRIRCASARTLSGYFVL